MRRKRFLDSLEEALHEAHGDVLTEPLPRADAHVRQHFLDTYGPQLEGAELDDLMPSFRQARNRPLRQAVSREVRLDALVDSDLFDKVVRVAQAKSIPINDLVQSLLQQFVQANFPAIAD